MLWARPAVLIKLCRRETKKKILDACPWKIKEQAIWNWFLGAHVERNGTLAVPTFENLGLSILMVQPQTTERP